MTAPEPHGYPDWVRQVATSDKLLDAQTRAAFTGPETFGPYFVGDVEWIQIIFTASVNNFRARFSFVDDAIASNLMSQQDVVFRSVATSSISLPVRGPYLLIETVTDAAGAGFNFILSTGKTGGLMVNAQSTENVLISTIGTAVGAGATVQLLATRTHPGPAVWSIFTALATWNAMLNTLDHTGGLTRLDTIDNTNAKAERRTYLPYQPGRITFTNTTGAGGTVNAVLLAAPTWPMGG